MDKILHTDHTAEWLIVAKNMQVVGVCVPVFPEVLLDDFVVRKRNALLVYLAIAALCE